MRWSLFLFVSLAAAPASAQCRISGPLTAPEVRIDVPDGPAFEVDLEEQDATVTVSDAPRATFESRGALEFGGSLERSAVRTRLARAVRVGPLHLRPGTAIGAVTVAGAGVAVEAELMDGVSTTVGLPCGAVRLGATADPGRGPAGATRSGDLLTTGRTLRVHRAPAAPDSVVLRIASEPVRLARVARRRGWVHVRRDFFDGSTLDGWVRDSGVRAVPEEELRETLWGSHIGLAGSCARGSTHTYRGPATLRAGAVVRTEPDGPVWARARRDVEVRVFWRWDQTWVAIEGAEGLRSRGECANYLERAHARLEDVVIPGVR